MSSLHEECGVFGVFQKVGETPLDVASAAYYGLFALQHRGQESCGIFVNDCGVPTGHKSTGLVNDVFSKEILANLGKGQMSVGHVRYSTTGCSGARNAQPMYVNHAKGSLVIAHNGNLTNAVELREKYEMDGCIFHTTSDTEVIAYTITRNRIHTASIEEAVSKTVETLEGAYSIVMMSSQKMIACRDPLGFRPLVIGELPNAYVFASETCALDAVGAAFVRDVLPGEIVVADENGLRSITEHCDPNRKKYMCIFEYIYFARPDSLMDGNSVHMARENAGAILAMEYKINADVVIGVPDSGLDAAIGYARKSGIPYAIGLIKNKYIGRTFIQPDQTQRDTGVRIKLNPVPPVVKGKRVIMVDDSLVRGTTVARTVRLLRDAGAVEVHVMSAAPAFRYPCYFGTDIDDPACLIANQHENYEGIADSVGADSVGYLPVDQLRMLVRPKQGYCSSCFTGDYPVRIPGQQKKMWFEEKIAKPLS
ncbi:MAG: amidophosphoribosyltransferase [Oscillospiraceae bacterium]|jgi:amidophosphoribosyltransferase|nr:amidophosphoribosyltransferase [Oscillospiraceae bacterium]